MSVMPGSIDDLRSFGDYQAPFSAWRERNLALTEDVRTGRVPCCGEWMQEGYHGWCSLLGKADWRREIGRDEFGPRYERCGMCPRAFASQEKSRRDAERGEWYVILLSEFEAICQGEIDV